MIAEKVLRITGGSAEELVDQPIEVCIDVEDSEPVPISASHRAGQAFDGQYCQVILGLNSTMATWRTSSHD